MFLINHIRLKSIYQRCQGGILVVWRFSDGAIAAENTTACHLSAAVGNCPKIGNGFYETFFFIEPLVAHLSYLRFRFAKPTF